MSGIIEEIRQCGGIEGYVYNQQYKSLLRFLTCGSVDDGKSTLIGRLLYDSSQIYDDQLLSLRGDSKFFNKNNKQLLNFALLVDGLQDEREQGITIDVAYRYFSTRNRKFIIADAPGHEEYTRNMVTAASTSNVAVLLVDVKQGIRNQTRRHTFIVTLLGIRDLIIAINKMDLVNYSQSFFEIIKQDYLTFIKYFSWDLNIHFIPISALYGENIVYPSKHMSWYSGLTLIDILNNVQILHPVYNHQFLRFPVQYVNYGHLDFRGYSGTIVSGELCIGKTVKVFPSEHKSKISRIVTFNKDLMSAVVGDPITVVLENDLDIKRGDIFLDVSDNTLSVNIAQVDVVWMVSQDLVPGMIFDVQIAYRRIKGCVKFLHYRIDINHLSCFVSDHLSLNGIGLIDLVFDEPILLDMYSYSTVTGSMIFIDPHTNITLGIGMVRSPINGLCDRSTVCSKFEMELHSLIGRHFPHWNIKNLAGNGDDLLSNE